MDLPTAGAYLALTPGSLLNLLRRENISPVDLGLRLRRWRRGDLDALVARLPACGGDTTPACPDPNQGVDWALAAVERRTAQGRRRQAPRRSHEARPSHPAA